MKFGLVTEITGRDHGIIIPVVAPFLACLRIVGMVQFRDTCSDTGHVHEIVHMARGTVSRSTFIVSQVTPVILGIHHAVRWCPGHWSIGILVAGPAGNAIVMRGRNGSLCSDTAGMTGQTERYCKIGFG